MIDVRDSRSRRSRTRSARRRSTSSSAACSTSAILTIDLMLLKPYFHGTTSRSGAPFWLGRSRPYMPVARIASGCIASSMRSPSRYGQSSTLAPLAGHLLGIEQRLERHVLRARRRLEAARGRPPSGMPTPRDHHRPRLDAAQPVDALLERDAAAADPRARSRRASRPRRRRAPSTAGRRTVRRSRRGRSLRGAELVEVVVGARVVEGRRLLGGREAVGRAHGAGLAGARLLAPPAAGHEDGGGGDAHRTEHLAPAEVEVGRGRLALRNRPAPVPSSRQVRLPPCQRVTRFPGISMRTGARGFGPRGGQDDVGTVTSLLKVWGLTPR